MQQQRQIWYYIWSKTSQFQVPIHGVCHNWFPWQKWIWTHPIFFVTITSTHMRRKWAHWVNWTIHKNNQGAREMWLPLHAIQKFHKVNNKIISTRHGNLPKNVPIQNWDIKWPQPISNNPRVPQSRLQQENNHNWVICTGLHSHHQQHQAESSMTYCTMPRKLTGRILFNVSSHWKIDPLIHVDISTN